MKILGLNINAGQSAAALLVDGAIVFAAAEERFDRIKQSRSFPKKAIRFCLEQANIMNPEQLDGIAISWNPAENMRHINLSGFTSWRRYDPEWLYIVPNHIMSIAGEDAFPGNILKIELGLSKNCPIYFVDHHLSHIAHAICQSPFESGLAMAIDEYGEFHSVTVTTFSNDNYKIIKRIQYPNSLGVFFAAITEFLGFTPNSDEWKVMGAAAYGNPHIFYEKIKSFIEWDESLGEWVLDTRYIEHSNMKRAGYVNERFIKHMGLTVKSADNDMTQEYYDIAAAAQLVFEEMLFKLINFYSSFTGETNLAASGGCMMNSLANGKIINNTRIKNLFIPYAAADNGGAMGAALYSWHYELGNHRKPIYLTSSPYLGPSFTDEKIEDILKKFKIKHYYINNITEFTAKKLAEGKLVGWFQGKMEFGERALGNRSILADPRDVSMKDRINAAVKYREGFRPFAPSILAERVSDYFHIPENMFVPYMEQVFPIREKKRSVIPAVVHADGTGRLQMVSRETNPLFYKLIQEFEKLVGIPLVLNTSFNVQGEPIVCTPSDAIKTFFSCGLDIIVLGSYVVEK